MGWNIHLSRFQHWWVSVEQFYICTFSFRPSVLHKSVCDLFLHMVHWFPHLILRVFPLPFDTKLNFNSDEGVRTAERGFCWTLNEIFWELITLQASCPRSSLNPVPLPGLLFPAKGSSLSPRLLSFLDNNCSLPAPFAFSRGRPLLLIAAWFARCQKNLSALPRRTVKQTGQLVMYSSFWFLWLVINISKQKPASNFVLLKGKMNSLLVLRGK